MKLPVGSRERAEYKIGLEQEIVKAADKWEIAREAVSGSRTSNGQFTTFVNAANKLATLVRKWRRL